MPILTISELVLSEISQMKFMFGGSPADVVEYEDGGRKASGQAISVKGLDAVTDEWIVYPPTTVPTADANGLVPSFFGPKGVLALRVDFGHGEVVLRADAANLHKELRDVLIARLSELQVDNSSFRSAVTGELNAMRSELDNAVADALADVETLIDTALGDQIEEAVGDKLATDLQPTLTAAINDALANDVPPLITAEVAAQVPDVVDAEVSGLQSQISTLEGEVDAQGVTLANTRFSLDATTSRVTSAENQITAIEVLLTLQKWQRTSVDLGDADVTLRLTKFQDVVFGSIEIVAAFQNAGTIGYVSRSGMGIPAGFLPSLVAVSTAAANYANGELINTHNFRVGINPDGSVYTQGNEPWNLLRANFVYFTS